MRRFASTVFSVFRIFLFCQLVACGRRDDCAEIWENGFGKTKAPEFEFLVNGESLGIGEDGFCRMMDKANRFETGAVISIRSAEGILSRDSLSFSDVFPVSLEDENLFGRDFVDLATKSDFKLR